MQAHKLSSYNTELSNSNATSGAHSCVERKVERKVELVKGKALLKTVVNKPTQKKPTNTASSRAAAGQFDFAGLAG